MNAWWQSCFSQTLSAAMGTEEEVGKEHPQGTTDRAAEFHVRLLGGIWVLMLGSCVYMIKRSGKKLSE